MLKREKRSESHLLLERKNHIMQISKARYKKQNKIIIIIIIIIKNETKIVAGAYIPRKKMRVVLYLP